MRWLASVAALLLASPTAAQGVATWQPYIDEASVRFAVPVSWIVTVMRIESGGRTTLGGRPITSAAGAMGLMQLMPATWTAMRERLALGTDPFDPHDNILAGTLYLRLMYDRFGYPGCFAAYNAGPGRYAAYLDGSRRLPAQTINYVASAGGRLGTAPVKRTATLPSLFAVSSAAGDSAASATPPPSLFAIAPRP